jgi:hypothetical protein
VILSRQLKQKRLRWAGQVAGFEGRETYAEFRCGY